MAGYFKKRRGSQGPNKNEQKVARARSAENQARLGGMVREKFPRVRRLRISLTFLDARQEVLDEKALVFGPSEAATFTVACPGRCGIGSFDFGGKIADAVGAGLPVSEGSAKCPEALYAGAAEACGCEVRCRMEIDYFPAAESSAEPRPDAPGA